MNTISKILIAASAIALTAAPRAWSAPEVTAPQPQAAQAEAATIKLKHMAPSWIARALASAPRYLPVRDTSSLPAGALLGFSIRDGVKRDIKKGTPEGDKLEAYQNAQAEDARKAPLSLPESIQILAPDDATDSIQARGTAEGVARLRAVVELLDKPLSKVEIEVQTVRLNRANMAQFGIDFAGNGVENSLGFLRRDYRQALRAMLDANTATMLMDVRATTVNNIGGTFSSGAFGTKGSPIPKTELQFTPTINKDGTITVGMESRIEAPGTAPAPGVQKIQTMARVQDGDTIVLGGLDHKESAQVTVTFLTARIVHDAEELEQK